MGTLYEDYSFFNINLTLWQRKEVSQNPACLIYQMAIWDLNV